MAGKSGMSSYEQKCLAYMTCLYKDGTRFQITVRNSDKDGRVLLCSEDASVNIVHIVDAPASKKRKQLMFSELHATATKYDFAVQKFFKSYLEIMKTKDNDAERFKNIIVFTNLEFDYKSSETTIKDANENLSKHLKRNFFIDVTGLDKIPNVGGKLYKFNLDDQIVKKPIIEMFKFLYTKTETNKATEDFIESYVCNFLSKLIFAVGQTEENLTMELKRRIGNDFDLHGIAYKYFLNGLYKCDRIIRYKQVQQVLRDIGGFKFNSKNPVIKKCKNFLDDRMKRQVLCIYHHNYVIHTMIMVQQAIESNNTKDKSYSYDCLKYLCLLHKNKREKADPLGMFENQDCAIIECDVDFKKDAINLMTEFYSILAADSEKKMILLIPEKYKKSAQNCLQKLCQQKAKEIKYDQIYDVENWFEDLAPESQKYVSNKTVLFQGKETPLIKLLPTEESRNLIDDEVLYKLINREIVTVGEEIPEMSCDQECYIPRELHPIDPVRKVNVTDSILDTRKRIILCAGPGMGKSTELIQQARRIKKSKAFTIPWVVLINVSYMVSKLSKFQYTKGRVFQFLAEVLNLKNDTFERDVFMHYAKNKTRDIVVLLDSFDEVGFKYEDAVIGILKELSKTHVKQIWISSRRYFVGKIKELFDTDTYSFDLPSERDQERFLESYWRKQLGTKQIHEIELKNHARMFLDTVQNSPAEVKFFVDNPLLLRMLADVFQSKCLTYSSSKMSYYFDFSKFMEIVHLDMLDLYELFVEVTLKTHLEKNLNHHDTLKELIKRHKLKALKQMFTYGMVNFEFNDGTGEKKTMQLEEIDFHSGQHGIIDVKAKGELSFKHITFAEYFTAVTFADKLKSELDESLGDFFHRILMFKRFQQVRYFFDQILEKHRSIRILINENNVKYTIRNWLLRQYINPKLKFTALSLAAASDLVHVTKLLLKCLGLERPGCLNVISEALIYALRKNYMAIVETILDFVEEVNKKQLINIIINKRADPDGEIMMLANRRRHGRIREIFLTCTPNFETIFHVSQNCSTLRNSPAEYLSANPDLLEKLKAKFGDENVARLSEIKPVKRTRKTAKKSDVKSQKKSDYIANNSNDSTDSETGVWEGEGRENLS